MRSLLRPVSPSDFEITLCGILHMSPNTHRGKASREPDLLVVRPDLSSLGAIYIGTSVSTCSEGKSLAA